MKKNRLSRWLGRGEAPPGPQSVPSSSEPDPSAHLLTRLGIAAPMAATQRLMNLLLPNSALVIEGVPHDCLDFKSADAHTLQRAWLGAGAWQGLAAAIARYQRLDGRGQRRAQPSAVSAGFAGQMAERVRVCNVERLTAVVTEQLEELAQLWRIPCVALVLPEISGVGWRVYCQYSAHTAPELWQVGQRLGSALDQFDANSAHQLKFGSDAGHAGLQSAFGNANGFLIPHSRDNVAKAWLMFGFYDPQQQAPDLGEREWLNLCSALAGPVLFRLSEQHNRHHVERLAVLQDLLGTGWWGRPDRKPVAYRLAGADSSGRSAGIVQPPGPAARQRHADAAVRASGAERSGPKETLWFRIQGQALVSGQVQRVLGFMLDVSDIKNQETEAAAAHARLDNLIASSPAVIYVQRYDQGNLEPTFFSDSLTPLLGWTLADCVDGQLAEYIHPEDRDIWFERTRQLLREGFVSRRYRLRDRQGDYHWLLDEARLLRDDLGIPVEAVGLWLDVTEATLAAEQVRKSEERYRILVEDSPAMICRYTPDLVLSFGNRPLANYMECTPEQLTGINLGDWLSDEQREAFIRRIGLLTPESPLSTEEICIELPGREYAWWVWADRGVFDEQASWSRFRRWGATTPMCGARACS